MIGLASGVARNSQRGGRLAGVWGRGRLKQGVLEGRSPSAGRFLQFSTKIKHFYACSVQNSCFKALPHKLKAFEKQSKRIK